MSTDTVEREFTDFDWGKVEYLPKSHRYSLCIPIDSSSFAGLPDELRDLPSYKRTKVPGVTTVIGILEKKALLRWYGAMDSQAVLEEERAGHLIGIPDDQAIHVVRKRGLGAEAARDSGAARGIAVHKALAEYCESGVIPSLAGLGDSTRPYVQALASWLLDASPEPLMVEQIVGSPVHGFAGRFDLLAKIDGQTVLLDCKTSPNAFKYPEASLQMAGYRIAMEECGIEPPEKSLILCLTDSGTYEVGEAAEADFLAVLGAHRAVSAARKALKNG